MDATIETPVVLPQALFDQAQALARQLNLTPSDLFARAVEHFVAQHHTSSSPAEGQATQTAQHTGSAPRVIRRGDLYWVAVANPGEPAAAIAHPHVVVQDDLFNHSRIHMVVVCALTSNLRRTSDTPGNVLLEAGEGNLPKASVVEVSKVSSVEKTQLGAPIGALSEPRMRQILAGMRFLQRSSFDR